MHQAVRVGSCKGLSLVRRRKILAIAFHVQSGELSLRMPHDEGRQYLHDFFESREIVPVERALKMIVKELEVLTKAIA